MLEENFGEKTRKIRPKCGKFIIDALMVIVKNRNYLNKK